jgi:hypothetical protein
LDEAALVGEGDLLAVAHVDQVDLAPDGVDRRTHQTCPFVDVTKREMKLSQNNSVIVIY